MKFYLEDGAVFEGESFGANVSATGEAVFTTGMVGYVESLSDPSYTGQILVCTYPLVGNYGVPDEKFFESAKIHAAGLIVSEYSENYSHHSAKQSLAAWLKKNKVPAITGVDTRAITKILRERGVMLGQISATGKKGKFVDPNKDNLVAKVSPAKKTVHGKGDTTIVLVDCGAKENIARSLLRENVRLIRVPWNYDFTQEEYDGVVISNGPGDPSVCGEAVENIRKAFAIDKPMLGICLGTQLMALAAGASTYKLKYGHRSQNQPCSTTVGGVVRSYITSQNHGYAIDPNTLPSDWKVWFTNANDGSVEGIRHKTKKWRSVQFHPEAAPGPTDTRFLFDDFLKDVAKAKKSS